jgi:hypothetical protein
MEVLEGISGTTTVVDWDAAVNAATNKAYTKYNSYGKANTISEVVKEEVIYKDIKEIDNPIIQIDSSYFLSKHKTRLRKLGKTVADTTINSNHIWQYLQALSCIEQDDTLNDFSKMDNYLRSRIADTGACINMLKTSKYSVEPYMIAFLKYSAKRLPFCCGVTEYGDFGFPDLKMNKELFYNLLIDLIRLKAASRRQSFSGAVGIINYFINTDFMKVLEKRDDLFEVTFFTNPKTSAKLKMFKFDTKI